jgi:hypothetical protein
MSKVRRLLRIKYLSQWLSVAFIVAFMIAAFTLA